MITDAGKQAVGVLDAQIPLVTTLSSATHNTSSVSSAAIGANAETFSVPLDGGFMKINSSGAAKYVSSSHWAAILDSIAELNDHVEQEEETRNIATEFHQRYAVHTTWPQLLYDDQRVTKADILSSIPTRRAADRLVSRYFSLNLASGKPPINKSET